MQGRPHRPLTVPALTESRKDSAMSRHADGQEGKGGICDEMVRKDEGSGSGRMSSLVSQPSPLGAGVLDHRLLSWRSLFFLEEKRQFFPKVVFYHPNVGGCWKLTTALSHLYFLSLGNSSSSHSTAIQSAVTRCHLELSSPPVKSLQVGSGRTPPPRRWLKLWGRGVQPRGSSAVLSFYPEEMYPHILNQSVRCSWWTSQTTRNIPKSPVEVHLP